MTSKQKNNRPCVLCGSTTGVRHFYQSPTQRLYWHCEECDLVFMDPSQRLDAKAERVRYLSHNNDPLDPRYQQYLAKVMQPVWAKYPWLAQGIRPAKLGPESGHCPQGDRDSAGSEETRVTSGLASAPCGADEAHWRRPLCLLDYGCGPTRGIETIWGGPQLQVTSYDPIFFPITSEDGAALGADRAYDVIVCCEAAEHFYDPAREFAKMARLLRPSESLIVLRTGWRTGAAETFAQWGYPHDPTHVCFYSQPTMEWIRSHWQLPIVLV